MRTAIPTADLFTRHRQQLAALLKPSSIVVVHSNDVHPANADATLTFVQNTDLYHLTGIHQEETILILAPHSPNPKDREILFIRESNETIAVWEGEKFTKEGATQRSGITRVEYLSSFHQILNTLVPQFDHIYLATNEHLRAEVIVETRNARFIKECQARFPLHRYERLAPLTHSLRVVKDDEEIQFTQKACDITEAGFRRILAFVKPGVGEWEVEAELIHEFTRRGSRGFAYHPIIASGKNACILHYNDNNQTCNEGDLLLLDVAAEYAGWNSDMTRTIPVSGRFTPRQREVYDAVLRTLNFANSILRPGILLVDYQKQVVAYTETELIKLGLISQADADAQSEDKPLTKKYFMHGTSHHLGLDVHDVAPPHLPIAVGHLLTIEPGIYIREENIGIRLENDVLIGTDTNIDLMANIPILADEIEALMNP